jgi:predicted ribosome quality control (RQC) complex YloA/Tae2 family protein
MATDGIFLHFIKEEIKDFAVGAKVDKIYLPTRHELVMVLRSRTESRRLFISVSGNAPRVNFTATNPENPSNPPMLCMLFRKQLTGAVITDVRQFGFDRVLFIDMIATNELGDRVNRTLIIEIMAQYSNCILLDENNIIIDSLKRVDSSKSSFREVLPQREYVLPPSQDKLNPEISDGDTIKDRVLTFSEKKLSQALVNTVSGMSPLSAKEIAYRVTLSDPAVSTLTDAKKDRLLHEINILKDYIRTGCKPCFVVDKNGEPVEFSFMPLTSLADRGELKYASSLSEILDFFYVEREKLLRAKSKAEDLFRLVASLTERTSKKINNLREELSSAEDAESKRINAELINANLYALKKGDTVYKVADYYNDYKIVEIPARPNLSPAQNAQRYYKEYRKAQTAKKVLAEQIEIAVSDLEYLVTVKDELSRAETERELNEIRTELSAAGFLKSKTGTRNKKNAPMKPLEFRSPNGLKVLVGRNNTQNDILTFKTAAKNDMWFHVHKAPGSHVVLCCGDITPDNVDMEFAAGAAAWFSSVRSGGTVEVDYTKIRNIKKPPASHPGFVIYHVYDSAMVRAVNPEQGAK